MNNSKFNIDVTSNLVNSDINITYTPSKYTSICKYTVYKDDVIFYENSSKDDVINIALIDNGKYNVIFYEDEDENFHSEFYTIDKEKPVISTKYNELNLKGKEKVNFKDYIIVSDNYDKDLINKVTFEIEDGINNSKIVHYKVVDQAGNIGRAILKVNYSIDYIFPIIFFILLFNICIYIFKKIFNIIKINKRINRYIPKSSKENKFIDTIYEAYTELVLVVSAILEKSVLTFTTSKRYNKYIGIINNKYKCPIDFISSKIIMSFLFLILAFIITLIQNRIISIYEIIFPILLGYYILDFSYMVIYSRFINQTRYDKLQAMVILNNELKNNNFYCSIEKVSNSTNGIIQKIFKNALKKIQLGVNKEDIICELGNKLEIKELCNTSILVKEFGISHKIVIKKLKEIEFNLINEINNFKYINNAKITRNILSLFPLILILCIMVFNHNYFELILNTQAGNILIFIIALIYIIYLLICEKILKIRM